MNHLNYSDYIIYVDESGDHGLKNINPQYPVFSLVFVVFEKKQYLLKVVPRLQKPKFDYFGHDNLVLHSHDIRKEKGPFALLRTNASLRSSFYEELNAILRTIPFEFFASVINKNKLIKKYSNPFNPYHIALQFCLEKVHHFLKHHQQIGKRVNLIVESRGRNEDSDLELEFLRITKNEKQWGYKTVDLSEINYNLSFAHKQINSAGLQLADLVARPAALMCLRPNQSNRAIEILKSRFKNFSEIKEFS